MSFCSKRHQHFNHKNMFYYLAHMIFSRRAESVEHASSVRELRSVYLYGWVNLNVLCWFREQILISIDMYNLLIAFNCIGSFFSKFLYQSSVARVEIKSVNSIEMVSVFTTTFLVSTLFSANSFSLLVRKLLSSSWKLKGKPKDSTMASIHSHQLRRSAEISYVIRPSERSG